MSRLFPMTSRRPSSAAPSARTSGAWSGGSIPPRASRRPSQRSPEIIEDPQDGADLVIVYAVPGCVLGHLRNITFCAWNTVPTAEHVHAFMALAKQLSAVYPKNSNITLVMRAAELPGSQARIALEELIAQYSQHIHSVAMVIDGDGFWASMIRSFLTGLHLLRGNGYRSKAFASPAEAIPWLLPDHTADTGVTSGTRELEAACEAIYRRLRDDNP